MDRTEAYHSLPRDLTRNADLYRQKRKACEAFGPDAGHTRQFLQFTWQVVIDRRRPLPPPVPTPPPLWPLRWRWNKILGGL